MLNTIFILGGLGLPKTFGFSHTPTEQGINLAAKIYLCYVLDKNRSAVYSADRCDFKESEKAVPDLYWIGGDISIHKAHNSGHIGHFRYSIPVRQV